MVLTTCYDMGDSEIMNQLPAKIKVSNSILVGLCSWDEGISKIAIHFDLDVLDSNEMIAGVGVDPNGMKIAETVRLIQDIAQQYDVEGLTIAEPMPRIAIKLKCILSEMPLLKD